RCRRPSRRRSTSRWHPSPASPTRARRSRRSSPDAGPRKEAAMRIALCSLIAAAALSGGGALAASTYTKIDDAKCETLKTYEDGGVDLRCPGLGDLDVFVSEGDARLDVDFGVKGENFETFSAFNNIGDTVEWLTNARGVPEAAIIRYL